MPTSSRSSRSSTQSSPAFPRNSPVWPSVITLKITDFHPAANEVYFLVTNKKDYGSRVADRGSRTALLHNADELKQRIFNALTRRNLGGLDQDEQLRPL